MPVTHTLQLQVEDLLEGGAPVDAQDAHGETALHGACAEGHLDVVRVLVVEQEAPLEVQNWEGWTPLIWAVVRGHTVIAKFLIDRVRTTRHWDAGSRFVLLLAISSRHCSLCKLSRVTRRVHMQGSSLHATTFLGWTPLHYAALQSNLALVEYMLEEGADASACSKDGCMPGDSATHPEVRQILFATGALASSVTVNAVTEMSRP